MIAYLVWLLNVTAFLNTMDGAIRIDAMKIWYDEATIKINGRMTITKQNNNKSMFPII